MGFNLLPRASTNLTLHLHVNGRNTFELNIPEMESPRQGS